MGDILIRNATIVTVDPGRRILEDAALRIEGDRITDLGESGELEARYPDAGRVIDATGKAVFPGLVNTHNHMFQSLLKGLGDDRVLSDWLVDCMFPSAARITEEAVYHGGLVACLDNIHSGTTTILDYMHAQSSPRLSDAAIRAFRTCGVRGILGRGFMDLGEEFGTPPAMIQEPAVIREDIERLLDTYHGADDGRIGIWLAPAAVWLASREILEWTRETARARGTGITVHCSETPFDREACTRIHGMPDTDTLAAYGLLGPDCLLVHCVHLTDRDIRMLRVHDARVSHNPGSNMYLSSGVAPVPRLCEAGVTVGLATDGAASNNSNDMIEMLKLAALMQKVHHQDPTIITAEKVLEIATIDGARALGMDDQIGSLEIGKKADLFLFDPHNCAKSTPMHHPVSTLVYSGSEANVETVIVDGRVILDGFRPVFLDDERAVLREAQRYADELAQRAGTHVNKRRPWRTLAY